MNKLLGAVLIASTFTTAAQADLSSDYTSALWTISENGGSIGVANNAVGAPGSITLVSSNNGSGAANQDITFVAFEAVSVTFDWSFETQDAGAFWSPGARFDPFGYLHNGSFNRLTDNNGADTQSGSLTFDVLAGEIFGFRARTVDGIQGAATTTVSNLSTFSVAGTSVPLPPAIWLLSAALGGLFTVKRRQLDHS